MFILVHFQDENSFWKSFIDGSGKLSRIEESMKSQQIVQVGAGFIWEELSQLVYLRTLERVCLRKNKSFCDQTNLKVTVDSELFRWSSPWQITIYKLIISKLVTRNVRRRNSMSINNWFNPVWTIKAWEANRVIGWLLQFTREVTTWLGYHCSEHYFHL